MAEQPPLNRSYVISYAANDKDYPTIGIRFDPRVAGYRVPEDLSPHPDSKRYPNHVFTGSQPSNGDERVTHIYEILPSPYVPFTRYDDDLGPVQGRRRSVKNEGQVASLDPDKRITYEAREGSAIVYTEIEESWSIKTDSNGNSLFPIRDRDFYDASRGAVQERRQLIVPTGTEQGTLAFVADSTGRFVSGVITQTSYEPYNQFLSFKIVQTYRVDGPRLIGRITNEQGQVAIVTTQRRSSRLPLAPIATAKRTVEVSREDAESVIERVVEIPNVFNNRILSASKPDVIPEQFRATKPTQTTQETVEQASASMPTLGANDLEKSEQRVTEHTVRKSTTSRDNGTLPELDGIDYEEQFDVQIPYKEKIVSSIDNVGPSSEADPLSDEFLLVREYDKDDIASYLNSFFETHPTSINMDFPKILKNIKVTWDEEQRVGTAVNQPFFEGGITSGSFSDSEQRLGFMSATPIVELEFEEVWSRNIPATVNIFFVRNPVTTSKILQRVNANSWPVFKPTSHVITGVGASLRVLAKADVGYTLKQDEPNLFGFIGSRSQERAIDRSITPISVNIPPSIHNSFSINQERTLQLNFGVEAKTPSVGGKIYTSTLAAENVSVAKAFMNINIPSTGIENIPRTGTYLVDSNVEFFKYGFSIVRAVTINAGNF